MDRQFYQLEDENAEKLVQAIEEQTSKLASIKGIEIKKKTRKKRPQSVDKNRQIYQQKKDNNERIVEAIKENTEVLAQVVQPQEIPDVNPIIDAKLVNYFTKDEVNAITKEIVDLLQEEEDDDIEEEPEKIDYSKLEEYIRQEVSKIPKPENKIVENNTTVVQELDVNSVIIEVLKQVPKYEEVDYKKIEDFCVEIVQRMEKMRPRVLNSAGPTTRITEMADVVKEGQSANTILFFNGTNWVYKSYSLSQLNDTNIQSPTNGQVLKYNDGLWVNSTDSDAQDLQSVTDLGSTTTHSIVSTNEPTFTYTSGQLTGISYSDTTTKVLTYNGDGTLDTLTITLPDSSVITKTFNWSGGILQSITIV